MVQLFGCTYFLSFQKNFMSNKQKAIAYCKEVLQSWNLLQYYNENLFLNYYKNFNPKGCNTYTSGLNAASYIIKNQKI